MKLKCGYESTKGQCGYHQHDPKTGEPVNPCQRPVGRYGRRCNKHWQS